MSSVDTSGAQRASRQLTAPRALRLRGMRAGAPRVLLAALALAVAVPVSVSAPAASPVQAATCTGWTDKVNPPRTIRVLRTKTDDPNVYGRVQTVDFRRYVETVMADEWPSYFPAESLKAAATAVKQYGWYYTMHGRSSYVTSSGACYDVKDSTIDQLYRPEIRSAKAEHKAAVTATWGLSVRRSGVFFLTGYRSGSTSASCGSDATGTRLYAWSVYDCGRDGKSRREIQRIYYGSSFSEVWSDQTSGSAPAPAPATNTYTEQGRVSTAVKRYIGKPHQDGAMGPNSFSSAGLVYRSFADAGLLFRMGGKYRTPLELYSYFKSKGKADRVNPRVGDLVAWAGGRHVGVYVGNGYAVSALKSGVKQHTIGYPSAEFTAYLHTGLSATATPVRATTQESPLRSGPGRSYSRIATLPANAKLTVLGSALDERGVRYHKVRTSSGKVGWVSSNLTRAL